MRRVAIVLAACSMACETGTTTAPAFTPRAVVHAVLDVNVIEQRVIVEQTRQSRAVDSTNLASTNPIIASGGTPISGAIVSVTGPTGSTSFPPHEIFATEDPGFSGAGVYRMRTVTATSLTGAAPANTLVLVPGARYDLKVVTQLGTVRGHTRVPNFASPPNRVTGAFNLDRDTLWMPRVANDGSVAGYLLRHVARTGSGERYVPAVTGPLLLFPVAPNDDRAWAFSFDRPDIRPGTTQTFVVAAVDSNVFKYNVAGFDPFGDDTQGNTLQGGVGLFGAVALMLSRSLDLVADSDQPIEQNWISQTRPVSLPSQIRVYESPRFPGVSTDGTQIFAGTARTAFGQSLLVNGVAHGSEVELALGTSNGGFVLAANGTIDPASRVLTLQDQRTGERIVYRAQ
jgi:hypothetical protein